MHILLTDLLTCPRCGPDFGLIVLADRMDGRRVIEGRLGCANCRSSYPVSDGIVDLRRADVPELAVSPPPSPLSAERAFRLGALIGARPMGARVLLVEAGTGTAAEVADILRDAAVVGSTKVSPPATADAGLAGGRPEPHDHLQVEAGPESGETPAGGPGGEETGDTQRSNLPEGFMGTVAHGNRLPYRNGTFVAAAVAGTPSADLLAEVVRVVAPGGRIVVESAGEDTVDTLQRLESTIVLDQEGTVVASAPGRR